MNGGSGLDPLPESGGHDLLPVDHVQELGFRRNSLIGPRREAKQSAASPARRAAGLSRLVSPRGRETAETAALLTC